MVTPFLEHALDPCLRVLALPLRMLAAPPVLLGGGAGLPAGALDIPEANLILAATPCDAPLFHKSMRRVCLERKRDILLVRAGLFPEALDPVTADVALCGPDGPLILNGLSFLRARGDLWLVPSGTGPGVLICEDGLDFVVDLPFPDPEERSDGLCRAAAEIVRLMRYGRAR